MNCAEMSEFKNFRITLHLNNFFRDHRTKARLFINKQLTSIADLENHIKNIFNITNFYLTCKDDFLPPSEDIRILQNEDSVWVWNSSVPSTEVAEKCEEEQLIKKKTKEKKKKRKVKETINSAVSDFEVKTSSTPNVPDENINCPNWEHYNENGTQKVKKTNLSQTELKGKKNKKRKLINQYEEKSNNENVASENEVDENLESIANPSQSKTKVLLNVDKKRKLEDEETFKETKSASSNQTTLCNLETVVLNSSQIIEKNTKEQLENESKSVKIDNNQSEGDLSDTESFEYNFLKPNKCTVENNVDTESELKNKNPPAKNIIPEIISETNTSNLAENTESYSENVDKSDCDLAVEIKSFRHSSSVGALLKALTTMSDTASEQSFVTKRKRRRVRKRKSKKSTLENGYVQNSDFFPPQIYFNSSNIVTDDNIENTSLKSSKSGKGPKIHIKFDDTDDEVIASIVIADAEQNVIQEQNSFNTNLTENDLMKYPLMKNLIPRNRDIIAFKVLKISENYTPEISKSIIAEVINYEKEGGKTEVKILSGKEELLAPQGKFFMENNTEEEEEEKEKNEIFFWGNIVEPRLLFP